MQSDIPGELPASMLEEVGAIAWIPCMGCLLSCSCAFFCRLHTFDLRSVMPGSAQAKTVMRPRLRLA
eukprot:1159820-Pelagomonas_calceolata.AAC.5